MYDLRCLCYHISYGLKDTASDSEGGLRVRVEVKLIKSSSPQRCHELVDLKEVVVESEAFELSWLHDC